MGSELETWKLRDPLERVRAYLSREAGYGADFFASVEDESKALAEHVRSGCRALPDPSPQSLFDHVYVELPEDLRAQRDEFADFVGTLEEAAK
jgi:pyruvate dehydrogenase E1 component alpha subunit